MEMLISKDASMMPAPIRMPNAESEVASGSESLFLVILLEDLQEGIILLVHELLLLSENASRSRNPLSGFRMAWEGGEKRPNEQGEHKQLGKRQEASLLFPLP